MQKLREEKDEVPTIYSRACGFVETVDDFIGLGCLDRRKKDGLFRHKRFGASVRQRCE